MTEISTMSTHNQHKSAEMHICAYAYSCRESTHGFMCLAARVLGGRRGNFQTNFLPTHQHLIVTDWSVCLYSSIISIVTRWWYKQLSHSWNTLPFALWWYTTVHFPWSLISLILNIMRVISFDVSGGLFYSGEVVSLHYESLWVLTFALQGKNIQTTAMSFFIVMLFAFSSITSWPCWFRCFS